MIKVSTENAPKAIGPYSQAIKSGSLVFTSGQIPLDPNSGEIVGSNIEEQANQVLKNLKAVLEASGSGMENIVKTTCFLADMSDFSKFNEVYSSYIVNAPARSCVAVKTLPKNVLCEVEAIAELK
jgi:2-iminobutanoate/2-iminopropanoate deaminase